MKAFLLILICLAFASCGSDGRPSLGYDGEYCAELNTIDSIKPYQDISNNAKVKTALSKCGTVKRHFSTDKTQTGTDANSSCIDLYTVQLKDMDREIWAYSYTIEVSCFSGDFGIVKNIFNDSYESYPKE